MKGNKILVLVPHLKGDGGVTGYYNNLKLESICNIQYFAVNSARPQKPVIALLRVTFNYLLYLFNVITKQYQFIHLNPSLYPRSFYRDAVFIIIAKILNKKVLVFIHGWLEDYEQQIKESKLKSFLFKISFAKADKFIVLGQVFKNKLLQMGVSDKKDFFIETTVADSKYINEFSLDKKFKTYKERVVFLFLSRILRSKGIYIAVDAFKLFNERHTERDASLIIAGDGPELSAVKEYVKNQQIANVEFTGNVMGVEKNEVFLRAHVMFCPSFTEGMPLSILEGMLYGMPIISRITGALPDIIKQEQNGFLSESFDASVYTGFLKTIAFNEDLYKKIATNNHQVALQNYSTEKVRERMVKVYNSFL